MKRNASSALLGAFQSLRISPATPLRPSIPKPTTAFPTHILGAVGTAHNARLLSSTTAKLSWLEPLLDRKKKMMKGRARVATGGSTKGTAVAWGDFGLRMVDHDRRISAKQLKLAEGVIRNRLRGSKFRIYKRVNCNIGVFVSGNEHRMGKGKGSFDHWATRVAVNHIIFEVRGLLHEQVLKDALRLAGNKLPGRCEIVKKGDPPVVGLTKLEKGMSFEDLKRPWLKLRAEKLAAPSSTPSVPATPSTPQ